jgi:hypothetical protein
MMMGFRKVLHSSLFFIVLFWALLGEKQYGADSFISVNILLVAKQRVCGKVLGHFFRSIFSRWTSTRQKQFLDKDENSV